MSKRKLLLFIVTIGIRIVIQMMVPIWALADFAYDDLLMVTYAERFIEFGWLGEYDYFALNKCPGFGFLLAIFYRLRIPYTIGIIIIYSAVSVLFYIVIQKYNRNSISSYLMFVFVLFSPIMMDDYVTQRIYRNSVLPVYALMVITGFLALYFERNKISVENLFWGILAGLGWFGLSVTAENSIWMTCFCFGAMVLLISLNLIEKKGQQIKIRLLYLMCLFIPVTMNFLGINIVKIINYHSYGVYAINDWNDTYFAEMGKALIQIDYGEEKPGVYVNKETVEKLYEISPSFSVLQDYLNDVYSNESSLAYKDGEIERDFIMWHIRWATAYNGLYKDANETNAFYKQIYMDINQAFDDGVFEKKEGLVLSNLAGPLDFGELDEIISYSFFGIKEITTYKDLNIVNSEVSGPNDGIERMSKITLLPIKTKDEMAQMTNADIEKENNKIVVLNFVIKIYKSTSYILIILVVLVYLFDIIINIRNMIMKEKTELSLFVIKTGCLLTIWACTMSMSLIYYKVMPDTFREYYAAGVYPIWQVVVCISIGQIIKYVKCKKTIDEREC